MSANRGLVDRATLIFELEKKNMEMLRVDLVSYRHLRAHETVLELVCRHQLEKKKVLRHQPAKTKQHLQQTTNIRG